MKAGERAESRGSENSHRPARLGARGTGTGAVPSTFHPLPSTPRAAAFALSCLAALAFLAPPAAAADKKGGKPVIKDPRIPDLPAMDYLFSPRTPRFCTAKLVLRNPKKLRPLFLVGKAQEGKVEFRPADMQNLGSVAAQVDLDNLSGLVDIATGKGSFAIGYDNISAAPVDLERFVGTDWLKAEPRPRFVLQVKSLDSWTLHGSRPGQTQYKVNLVAEFKIGDKSTTLKQPVVVTITEASTTAGTSAHLTVRTEFTFKGADMGLTGDDAGEIKAATTFQGYPNVKEETKVLLTKVLSEPPEDLQSVKDSKP